METREIDVRLCLDVNWHCKTATLTYTTDGVSIETEFSMEMLVKLCEHVKKAIRVMEAQANERPRRGGWNTDDGGNATGGG